MKHTLYLCALLLAGCGTMSAVQVRQIASSGHVGCPPAEIAIADQTDMTWTATCKGQRFYCTVGTSCTAAR